MMTDKFCKDCKYFTAGLCFRPIGTKFDLVYGPQKIEIEIFAKKERSSLCERNWLERMLGLENSVVDKFLHPEKYLDDRCGPEGKYFEPSNPPDPPVLKEKE